jgi:hypothetical protein
MFAKAGATECGHAAELAYSRDGVTQEECVYTFFLDVSRFDRLFFLELAV